MQLRKGLHFTDIHWGKKSNSETHLRDCSDFIDWVCGVVSSDSSIDHIIFLGDWFDNRTAIHVGTLHTAYLGASKLNQLGIPVFFLVGNHDLHHRNDREVFSVSSYREFDNFKVINQPIVEPSIGEGALLVPFLFEDEYPALHQYVDVPFWAGHFEFKGFRITGYNVKMEHGPDASQFDGPTRILSGHFHARQTQANVTYIGNAFPMDYGDVFDVQRGCAVYDHTTDELTFHNWDGMPSYHKLFVSKLLRERMNDLPPKAYVKCFVDTDLEYEQSVRLKQQLTSAYSLREFVFEDVQFDLDTIEATDDASQPIDMQHSNVDQLIVSLLSNISDNAVDSSILVSEYMQLSQ